MDLITEDFLIAKSFFSSTHADANQRVHLSTVFKEEQLQISQYICPLYPRPTFCSHFCMAVLFVAAHKLILELYRARY